MDLTTNYLGMELRSPLVMSASPLSESVDNIKLAEDSGAGAVVLYSLFEEQIEYEQEALFHYMNYGTESFPEALSYLPEQNEYHTGPEGYLEIIANAKKSVDIPIIASINGSSIGGWTKFAKQMTEAGADAIELNIYYIPADINLTGPDVEKTYVDILKSVRDAVDVPVAVKLSPFFSNMAHMAKRLHENGANGLTLFNRFYQPDIDLENLEVKPNVLLSTPQALRLPLRWIAILYGRLGDTSLAATSGIHNAQDVLKVMMVGANVAMMASALLRHGVGHLATVDRELREWMTENEYESIKQMQGSMSQLKSSNPAAFERAQYMRAVSRLPILP